MTQGSNDPLNMTTCRVQESFVLEDQMVDGSGLVSSTSYVYKNFAIRFKEVITCIKVRFPHYTGFIKCVRIRDYDKTTSSLQLISGHNTNTVWSLPRLIVFINIQTCVTIL